jgi:hypothetical protein
MKQPIELPIGAMDIGDSFFVPCIDDAEIRRELARISDDFDYALRVERVINRGMYGLRVWRIEKPDI